MRFIHLLSTAFLVVAGQAAMAKAKKEAIPYCKPCGNDLLGYCGAIKYIAYDTKLMDPVNPGWDSSYTNAQVNVTTDVWEINPVILLHSDVDYKTIVSIDFFNADVNPHSKTIRHQVQGHQECTIPTYPEGFTGKDIQNVAYYLKQKL